MMTSSATAGRTNRPSKAGRFNQCFQQHTNVEFLTFLKQVAKAYPRVQLHVVCDNYATHKHPNIKA